LESYVVQISSITGPIDSSRLGFTLMHEHFFMLDKGLREEWPETFDRQAIIRKSVEALRAAKAAGVDTMVDLTTFDLGRDVRLTEEIVRQADVQVIPGTGMWLTPPRALAAQTPDFVAALFARDIEEGIQGTGVKAAIIKLASDDPQLPPPLEVMFRAGARAHRRTGVPISTHTDASQRAGLDQQRVFAEEGVDLTRVIIGHSGDTEDLDYLQQLLDRGSYLGLDRFSVDAMQGRPLPRLEQRVLREEGVDLTHVVIGHGGGTRNLDYLKQLMDAGSVIGMDRFGIGTFTFDETVGTVAELCRRGYAEQLVLSQDLVIMFDDIPPEGFTYIHRRVIPALLEAGVSQRQVDQMTRDAPRAIFERTGGY
jgi:phosphotriesterase-related protein